MIGGVKSFLGLKKLKVLKTLELKTTLGDHFVPQKIFKNITSIFFIRGKNEKKKSVNPETLLYTRLPMLQKNPQKIV